MQCSGRHSQSRLSELRGARRAGCQIPRCVRVHGECALNSCVAGADGWPVRGFVLRDGLRVRLRVGVAFGLLFWAVFLAAGAQAGSVGAGGEPPAASGPTGGGDGVREDILFAHDGAWGTFRPSKAHKGVYLLTLHGVKPLAFWFDDRPGRREGTVPLQRMLDGFFAKPGEVPPNAAVSAYVPERSDQVTMGVELVGGRYDRERRLLRYWVRELEDTSTVATGDREGIGETLPARFTDTSVLIDDFYKNSCYGVLLPRRDNAFPSPPPNTPPGVKPLFSRIAVVTANKASGDSWLGGSYGLEGIDPIGEVVIPQGSGEPLPARPASGNQRPDAWAPGWAWKTESGAFKGCWNTVTFSGFFDGSITASVDVPYTGSNSYTCTTSGRQAHCRYVTSNDLSTPNPYIVGVASQLPFVGPLLAGLLTVPGLGSGTDIAFFEYWIDAPNGP